MKKDSFFLSVLFLITLILFFIGFLIFNNFASSINRELYYDHIPLIPFLFIFLMIIKRRVLLSQPAPDIFKGLVLLIPGISGFIYSTLIPQQLKEKAWLSILFIIIIWSGTYLSLFGLNKLKMALFPIFFLFFAIPFPEPIMFKITTLISRSSIYVIDVLFNLFKIPFVREGIEYWLSGFNVVIDPYCAGFRSSFALIMVSLLSGYLFLKKKTNRLVLIFITFPIIIIKNGFRIFLLYLIGYYINERFMEGGYLHWSVGYFVFFLALLILGSILWALEKNEMKGLLVSPLQFLRNLRDRHSNPTTL